MTHLLTADKGHFLISTKPFRWRSVFDHGLHWLTWWPHRHTCRSLLADILMTAVNTAPGNVLLGTTPGYQKVFHEVMWKHHPIITPSFVASAFPDPGASQPSPLQGSLTVTPGNGRCWLQLSTGPWWKAIHVFHQRAVKMTAFSSQLGAESWGVMEPRDCAICTIHALACWA